MIILKIKVLFLLSNFRAGGAETQYANLISNINRKEFEPVLGLIQYKNSIPSEDFISRFGDVEVKIFERKHIIDFFVIFRICCFVYLRGINIIQSQLFMDNQIARFVGLLTRRPVITSVRGEIGALLSKNKMRFEFLAQFLSSRIVVNSLWLKDYLVDLGSKPDKVVSIYNGVDFSRYECDLDKEELRKKYHLEARSPVVTIVARLHPMKDHITFFDTIRILKSSYPNLVALVIGDGEEKDHLQQYVTSHDLDHNVRFLGVVGDKLAEIYQLTDLLLLTSQYGESFPNVILEAMSVSVPVVASNISAVSEIIDDSNNGFVVNKRNSDQFSEKSLLILSDLALREKIINKAKQNVRTFDIPTMVDNYETLYSSLFDEVAK